MPTTYMSMTIPAIKEAGPGWATEIAQDLATIDLHDHSAGKGAPLPAVVALSGAVSGNTAAIAGLSQSVASAVGNFTLLTGTTTVGAVAAFTSVSGAVGTFGSILAGTIQGNVSFTGTSFTTLTGTTTTGTLATFGTVTGTAVTGTSAQFQTISLAGQAIPTPGQVASYALLTGTTTTGTLAQFGTTTGTLGQFQSLAVAGRTVDTQPYDLATFFGGIPTGSAIMNRITLPRAITLPDALAGSVGSVGANPSGTVTLTIKTGSVAIATASIGTGGAFTFFRSGALSLPVGTVLSVNNQSGADPTLADVSVTIVGTRVL